MDRGTNRQIQEALIAFGCGRQATVVEVVGRRARRRSDSFEALAKSRQVDLELLPAELPVGVDHWYFRNMSVGMLHISASCAKPVAALPDVAAVDGRPIRGPQLPGGW